MEQKELMKEFDKLYQTMATSNEPKYMHIFGETMKCMMKDMIAMKTELACEYISKLEAIKWDNYLTKKEALSIVGNMNPKGAWDYADWEKQMDALDVRKEDMPYYNKYALYTAMNMVYSDSASTIALIAGKTLEDISDKELFTATHQLALDQLEDKDRVFDIRNYFNV